MQLAFYFDQSRCTGCLTCTVACKDWHDIPAGPIFRTRIEETEKGQFPDVSVTFFRRHCYHCAEPPCVPACPAGAIKKLADNGVVIVNQEACLGRESCGGSCLSACPYEAPQFGEERDARMDKCDLCLDRWREKRKPICVEACPMRALDAGSMSELEQQYGTRRDLEDFDCHDDFRPSVLFNTKK